MSHKHPRFQFTHEEDIKLCQLVLTFGEGNWRKISYYFQTRNERQCKDRWMNFLSPNINKGEWTKEEDKILMDKYMEIGSQWKVISKYLKGRTHVSIRNRFQRLKRNNAFDKYEKSKDNERKSNIEGKEKKEKDQQVDKAQQETPINNDSSFFEFSNAFDDICNRE